MIIMRCFSVFLGALIGYLYSFFAYRSYASGLCDANWVSAGMVAGYIGFYVLYGVMRWM